MQISDPNTAANKSIHYLYLLLFVSPVYLLSTSHFLSKTFDFFYYFNLPVGIRTSFKYFLYLLNPLFSRSIRLFSLRIPLQQVPRSSSICTNDLGKLKAQEAAERDQSADGLINERGTSEAESVYGVVLVVPLTVPHPPFLFYLSLVIRVCLYIFS